MISNAAQADESYISDPFSARLDSVPTSRCIADMAPLPLTVPTTAPRPTKGPQYGAEAEAESGAYEEDYYEDEEKFELEEAIAALEEGYTGEGMSRILSSARSALRYSGKTRSVR